MTLESFPEKVITKKIESEEDFDIERALEKPESIFIEKEASPETRKEDLAVYEKILSDEEKIIGSGNAAVVLEETEKNCIKCMWNSLDVEIKGKKFDLLPKKWQQLRKIQNYFQEINAKKRKLMSSNLRFEADNKPLEEAGFQITARKILEKEGLEKMVPELHSILRIKSEDEGEIKNCPYYTSEDTTLISMEKVNGKKNIEDLILGYPENEEVINNLDINNVKGKLTKAIKLFHENNLLHKDFSIRNVMIDFETGDPVIIDFGKSKYEAEGTEEKIKEEENLKTVDPAAKQFKYDPDEDV